MDIRGSCSCYEYMYNFLFVENCSIYLFEGRKRKGVELDFKMDFMFMR